MTEVHKSYIGIAINRKEGKACWEIWCPCGVKVEYEINGLPTATTKHPCDDPEHYSVVYFDEEK